MVAKWYEVSFFGDENVLKLITVIVPQLCEHVRIIELYTLYRSIMWYLNCVSIKLF